MFAGRPPSRRLPYWRPALTAMHPFVLTAGVHPAPTGDGYVTRSANAHPRFGLLPTLARFVPPSAGVDPLMVATATTAVPCCTAAPAHGRPSVSAVELTADGGHGFELFAVIAESLSPDVVVGIVRLTWFVPPAAGLVNVAPEQVISVPHRTR